MIARMKRLAFLILLALVPGAANIHTVATFTGTAAKVCISTDTTTRAKWIQVVTPAANSAVVRFGDSTVSATTGLPIAAGAGYNTPACESCIYQLAATCMYIANGDK